MYLSSANVGNVVRALRELRGLTQKELASSIGMTQGFVSYLEAGKKVPSMQALDRLVEGLDAVLVIQLREEVDASI